MRSLYFFACLLLLPSAQTLAQPPGLPGTATPQPYAQPQIRTLPAAPRSSPPLLAPQPLPRDQPLPQLDTRRNPQSAKPADASGKP
nr:hypothetical protein [Pseudomonas sp. UBA6718]